MPQINNIEYKCLTKMWKIETFYFSNEVARFCNRKKLLPQDFHITYDSKMEIYVVFYFEPKIE